MGTTRYNHPELGMANTKTNVVGFGLVCLLAFGILVEVRKLVRNEKSYRRRK